MNRIQFNIIIVLIGLLFVSSVFAVEITEVDRKELDKYAASKFHAVYAVTEARWNYDKNGKLTLNQVVKVRKGLKPNCYDEVIKHELIHVNYNLLHLANVNKTDNPKSTHDKQRAELVKEHSWLDNQQEFQRLRSYCGR